MSYSQYKRDVYSQNGEDGIIEFIFDRLKIKNGNFIEFGAWDGKHLSNCYKLFQEGWTGIYIEADDKKFETLSNTFKNEERLTLLHKMVSYTNNDNLDTIIDNCNHSNKDFDFISIDVDGLDYNIFKAMKKYLPKVICIEVNAGHSPLFDQEIDISIAHNNIGQSMTVICREALMKGYFPLCYTGNLFLVQTKFYHLFPELHTTPDLPSTLKNIYIDFLQHLSNEQLEYLYKTFVIFKWFNGMHFHNPYLEEFCKSKYSHIFLM